MRRLARTIIICMVVLGSVYAMAAESVTTAGTIQVGLLPVVDFARKPNSLWSAEDPVTASRRQAIDGAIEAQLTGNPLINVVTVNALTKRIQGAPGYVERLTLGLERMNFGLELYEELRVAEAIPHLKRARTLLTEAFVYLGAPNQVATLSLTLAQCYLEQGQNDQAHVALKEMFFRVPARRFQRGFYSENVEKALSSALVDFVATYPKENPVVKAERMQKLMRLLRVDVLVYPYIELTPQGPTLRMQVYNRSGTNVVYRGSALLLPDDTHAERFNRMVSRWTTCLPVEGFQDETPKPRGEKRFFIDTMFAYSKFLSDTATRRGFHNIGLTVSGEWRITGGLGMYGQFYVQSSTRSPDRDLLRQYTSVRLQTGLSYAIRRNWWRAFLRVGIEGHVFGDFQTTTNAKCKFFGGAHCDGKVEDLAQDFVMGPTTALGGSLFFTSDLHLTGRVTITYFTFPLDKATKVNFPLGGELGIGYSF